MKILGISAYYHDSAACLVDDGRIVAAAQEERFTRLKHDASFPAQAIEYCLREGSLKKAAELDYVVFYDKPIVKFQRLLETYLHHAPLGLRSFLLAMPQWLKSRLKMRELIREQLDFDGPILFTEHHESHGASAFYPSPFERAAILTIDGVGERATASIGLGEGRRMRILKELHFPHSLGLLYSAFTYFTGFKVNSGEYKLMGLAPYGEPKYVDMIWRELVDLKDDGSLALNMRYFDFAAGLEMTHARFADLFDGPARVPEGELTQREMDLARSIQVVTEEVMLRMARFAREVSHCENLVMAGGVALNCVGNGKILRQGLFDNLWIQPAAGDAGGALGAALFVYHQLLDGERQADGERDAQQASLLGPSFSDEEIGFLLNEIEFNEIELDGPHVASRHDISSFADDQPGLAGKVADLLSQGKVVGWFQGRMEFGPRALGARSILGDARNAQMQATLNLKIKFRESFRPFAPAVLREQVSEYFELDGASPYMLLVAEVARKQCLDVEGEVKGFDQLQQVRSTIPAVTHVDGSARVQTVDQRDHPVFHGLLEAFYQNTGCPVLVNTSFNVRGEPIVCTPEEAYRCFERTNMDVVVLGSYIVEKRVDPETAEVARNQTPPEGESSGQNPQDEDPWAVARDPATEEREARRFGLIWTTMLAVLGAGAWYLERPAAAGAGFTASLAVALTALFARSIWNATFRLWMTLAMGVGRLISKIVLSLFFYCVLTPAGLLQRILGEPVLDIAWRDGRDTFWRDKSEGRSTLERYQKMH